MSKGVVNRKTFHRSWFIPILIVVTFLFSAAEANAAPPMGANLWNIGWGTTVDGDQAQYNYFAHNVNWATATDPWNPTFIQELKQAQIHCLRFMDWGLVNNSEVGTWNQRIPKTA